MPNLFGINIPQLVAQSIQNAGGLRPGILQREVGGGGIDPTNPNRVVKAQKTQAYNFQGFVERRTIREPDTLIQDGADVVTILGGSITTPPQSGDKVVIDGVTYILGNIISADPSGAVYEFQTGGDN